VIDPSFYSGQRDGLLQLKVRGTRFSSGKMIGKNRDNNDER
jgi:hypothetical protein